MLGTTRQLEINANCLFCSAPAPSFSRIPERPRLPKGQRARRRRLHSGSERTAAPLGGRREHGVALAAHVEVAAVVQVAQLLRLERVLARGVLPAQVAHPNRVVYVPASANREQVNAFDGS